MKTKEDVAKILLERGWTLEEVNQVLKDEIHHHHHFHYRPSAYPVYPAYPIWQWSPYDGGAWTITDCSGSTTVLGEQ